MTARRKPVRGRWGPWGRLARCLVVLGVVVLVFAASAAARAAGETETLFASGVAALHEGRAGDAISAFEALADRGVVDPVVSYDRGLAYAWRVRHRSRGVRRPRAQRRRTASKEARDHSHDRRLDDDATRALTIVRSEVARRRARAGQPVEVDPGRSLSRALAGLLAEDTWAILAIVASATLSVGMFIRWLARATRLRIAGTVSAALAGVVLALSVLMTLAVRHDREHVREAVVVVPNARPTDAHGLAIPGATPLPEGARVEIVDPQSAWPLVRFGAIEARLGASALRELARAD